ncbi:hypothetical protein LPI49_29095, partial [Klebsiella pneumoniae]|nr:hypothetical protein [Klebsiella pneumoniae]
RIEFLNVTNNPVDQQLVGLEGRFHLLREVARDLGMPVSDTLPLSEAQIKQLQQALTMQAMAAVMGPAGGGVTGNERPSRAWPDHSRCNPENEP